MQNKFKEVKNIDKKNSLFLSEYDASNNCVEFVAHCEGGFYSSDSFGCKNLETLMQSEGELIHVSLQSSTVKALVSKTIITFYFYLSNERFFTINFSLSDFRDKLISIGAIK